MKHSLRITFLLLAMFLSAQLIGLLVVSQYSSDSSALPYGMEPPADVEPQSALDLVFSFAIAFSIVVIIMLVLTKYKAETFLRIWFFAVVTLAIGTTITAFILSSAYASVIALALALPLAFYKIFRRNILVHNLTELLIYPGIGAIFVMMLLSWTTRPVFAISIILVLISLYDMYAVWHAGFMQKMAQYQIEKLKLFTGFFVPYMGKKDKEKFKAVKGKTSALKNKKVKVSVAILGGGDVVFPIILAGVVLVVMGLLQALIISFGATLALAGLFYLSEKGKFYPAMPFISAGCFIALAIAALI